MTHTPGPWTVEGLQQNVRVSGYRIVGCGTTVALVVAGTGRAKETANLIAAAPDMLEALKKIDTELSQHRDVGLKGPIMYARGLARAAINKAEGRS